MSSIFQAIWSAILWCLEGVYGSLRAAIFAPTDVPPLQCILGSLALAAFGFLLDLGITRIVKRLKRRKQTDFQE